MFSFFGNEIGGIICASLKEKYRTEEEECHYDVAKTSKVINAMVLREKE
jgi:hypothetical protein